MATDFDDIFGDLKEDEHSSATLPSDFEDESIFGDSPGKPANETKPSSSAPPLGDSVGVSAPAAAVSPTPSGAVATAHALPVPEQSGAAVDDDDFLSWLDDGGNGSVTSVADAAHAASELMMDDISLDATVDTFSASMSRPQSAQEAETCSPPGPPAAILIHVSGSIAAVASTPDAPDTSQSEISLDDDDDDDFLEKIVENAKKKASGSRESSGSALHIKSQSNARQREPTIGEFTP